MSRIACRRRNRLNLTPLENRLVPATFVVNDPGDQDVGIGTAGTLSYCIHQANLLPGADSIAFNLAGGGVHTISPGSNNRITDTLTIDGATQNGYANGSPVINIVVSPLGSALHVAAANCKFTGLILNIYGALDFETGANGGTVQSCFVNTDPTGSQYTYNGYDAGLVFDAGVTGGQVIGNILGGDVEIQGSSCTISGNRIGVTANGEAVLALPESPYTDPILTGIDLQGDTNLVTGNLISGCRTCGVVIGGNNNVLHGNVIGLDLTGTKVIGNGDPTSPGPVDSGVLVNGTGNTIGGPNASDRNVISGNIDGILIADQSAVQSTMVIDNYIGTTSAGDKSLGNQDYGVDIRGSAGNTISGNVISGNGLLLSGTPYYGGLLVESNGVDGFSTGNVIQINLIGTDATGTKRLGNIGVGITLTGDNNTVGGVGLGNVIAGSSTDGISDDGIGNAIQGNFIGCNSSGTNANNFENVGNGITGGTEIGDYTAGAGNLVAFNGGAGIASESAIIRGNSIYNNVAQGIVQTGQLSPTISRNSIHDNGGLGIDLYDDGVTLNEDNGLNNFPILSSVSAGATTTIQGTYSSPGETNTTITLEFFASASADPTGYGEGTRYLGSKTITTDANGNANFTATGLGSSSSAEVFSATATSPDGTSEFSADKTAAVAPATVSGIVINGGAIQRSRVTSLQVTFSQVVNLPSTPATAFQLKRQSDNAMPALSAAVSTNGPNTVVTLSFTGTVAVDSTSLADGRYTLSIDASKVTNANGSLDGNGDGTGGDNYVLMGTPANGLFRLFGDADGNGTVNAVDFLAFRSAFGGNASAFDFNNNGSVDSNDFLAFRSRFGSSV